MKILIADDDRVVAQLIAGVVRKAGHVPLHAYDAMQTVMFASSWTSTCRGAPGSTRS
jgi:DNA-binding response OmpR family regulator